MRKFIDMRWRGWGCRRGRFCLSTTARENILAARAAGMVAVQYLGHPGFVEEMQRIGLSWLLYV